MEQSHSGLGEGQGRDFWSSGGMGSPWNPTSILQGLGAGKGKARNQLHNAALQKPANPSKCQAARNYLLGEGDLIDIRAPAEPGKEGDSK